MGSPERFYIFYASVVKLCEDKDENGTVIPWTHDVTTEHEDFMIYEGGDPDSGGFVFKLVDK